MKASRWGTLLLAALVASSVQADGSGSPLDHFLCYKTKLPKGTPRFTPIPGVTLRDQFERITFDVKKPLDVCNPAQKFVEPVYDARTHLKAYAIKRARGEPRPKTRDSVVKNQFHPGGLRVVTKGAKVLLVPTSKSLDGTVPPPPAPRHTRSTTTPATTPSCREASGSRRSSG